MGGRSRVAAQILSGKGYETVYNLSGGIKAYDGHTAIGAQDLGIALFDGSQSPSEILATAYSLEAGLEDFYTTMAGRVVNEAATRLFRSLAAIEVKHQERILGEVQAQEGRPVSRDEFEAAAVAGVLEGGLTTEEYLERFGTDTEQPQEVVAMAMSIEAQALDLYLRAAGASSDDRSREALDRIAGEEKAHLSQLGELMDSL